MKALQTPNRSFFSQAKRRFASHGPINPNLKDFDVIFVGGLQAANVLKYMQHTDFHGTMAGFCRRNRFYNEHQYEYLIHGNMKAYKYNSSSFGSNFNSDQSLYSSHEIVDIDPVKNTVTDDRGIHYTYKSLVLNTGLDQSVANMPFIHKLVQDGDFAESRVFVHNPSDVDHIDRNRRIFSNHKDNDFIVYLPEYPNRREAYDAWYLALDTFLTWGVHSQAHHRNMKVRVITPNQNLFRFPFANEVVMEEISQRSLIETHFGYEITNVEIVEKCPNSTIRYATFKNKATGEEMRLQFGSLLLTPNNTKRQLFKSNDIADESGQVLVNPYSLQHQKYPNIFAFGDCAKVETTKGFYATLNQGVVVRNNLSDYLEGKEFKAVYNGYSSFAVNHSVDRQWIFSHYYNYVPSFGNFYVPRFLGLFVYCFKNVMEKQFFAKVFQTKPNYGYPYLMKNKYFRPLDENKFLRRFNISKEQVLIHPINPPKLSIHEHHDHHHDHAHTPQAAHH
jgi:hypothetical protein